MFELPNEPAFHPAARMVAELEMICSDSAHANYEHIGTSVEDRPIIGVIIGSGARTISLIAGNHADEPVGPETLYWLIKHLADLAPGDELLQRFTFLIVPHTNPDGDVRNQAWKDEWPDLSSYLAHRRREKPGRDIEFGFPAMRPENEAVSVFLRKHAPFGLHMSLHGMGLSEGAMLLIDRHWCYRTDDLQQQFVEAATEKGLRTHDHNRKGEKGFFYVAPGFWTTPEGTAMRQFFQSQGDTEMAAKFHDSSMEFVQSLGGDPLCMVTELPLFVIQREHEGAPGEPAAYFEVKEKLADWTARAQRGDDLRDEQEEFEIEPLNLREGVELQLAALRLGLITLLGGTAIDGNYKAIDGFR